MGGIDSPVGWALRRVNDDRALVETEGRPPDHFFDLLCELPLSLVLYNDH